MPEAEERHGRSIRDPLLRNVPPGPDREPERAELVKGG
jgi:hypothetical protein